MSAWVAFFYTLDSLGPRDWLGCWPGDHLGAAPIHPHPDPKLGQR